MKQPWSGGGGLAGLRKTPRMPMKGVVGTNIVSLIPKVEPQSYVNTLIFFCCIVLEHSRSITQHNTAIGKTCASMTKKLLHPRHIEQPAVDWAGNSLQQQPRSAGKSRKQSVSGVTAGQSAEQRLRAGCVPVDSSNDIAKLTQRGWAEVEIVIHSPRQRLLQQIKARGLAPGPFDSEQHETSQSPKPVDGGLFDAVPSRQRNATPDGPPSSPSPPPTPACRPPSPPPPTSRPPPPPPPSLEVYDSTLSRSKYPNPFKTRLWSDQSGNFSVNAELLDWRDGKVELHKMNGVKVAVPMSRLCGADVEFVFQEMASRKEVVLPTTSTTPELEKAYVGNSDSALREHRRRGYCADLRCIHQNHT